MRHLSLLFAAIAFCLIGCTNHDDEPNYEFDATINGIYVPMSVTFDKSDTEYLNLCRPWDNKFVVVNSTDELPTEPFGFNDTYKNINFSDQTLLIYYSLNNFRVITCRNFYKKNIRENTYTWQLLLGVESKIEGASDNLTMTRYAILVPKVPTDAKVKVNYSLTSLDFDWEE